LIVMIVILLLQHPTPSPHLHVAIWVDDGDCLATLRQKRSLPVTAG
jgi:hypothetical protein